MNSDPSTMTAAQREAAKQAWDLLAEHFDGALLVLQWDVESDGKQASATRVYWQGGVANALGLAVLFQHGVLNNDIPEESDPP